MDYCTYFWCLTFFVFSYACAVHKQTFLLLDWLQTDLKPIFRLNGGLKSSSAILVLNPGLSCAVLFLCHKMSLVFSELKESQGPQPGRWTKSYECKMSLFCFSMTLCNVLIEKAAFSASSRTMHCFETNTE